MGMMLKMMLMDVMSINFQAVFYHLFLCVIIFGSPIAFGAVSSCKLSGPSFSLCKCAASAFFSGYQGVDFARKIFASISLAQAQFYSFFFVFLSLSPLLPFPSLAVFICLVEKCCGNFGRRFLRPGEVWGLRWCMVGVSLLPGGGKMTGGNRAAFPAPRQAEGVVLR